MMMDTTNKSLSRSPSLVSSASASDVEDAETETASPPPAIKNDGGREHPQPEEKPAPVGGAETNLAENIKRLESIIQSLKDSTTAQISQLRDLVQQKDKTINDLTEKLEHQRDYDDIRRELTFVRRELSHFGPGAVLPGALDGHQAVTGGPGMHPHRLAAAAAAGLNPFALSQLQSLGNVESFGTFLGEEIATSYAKAMVAAAAASPGNQQNSTSGKLSSNNATSNQNNNSNNTISNNLVAQPESLSPSQLSNGGGGGGTGGVGDESLVDDGKSTTGGSASTTPTSSAMMICAPDVVATPEPPPVSIGFNDLSALHINLNSPASQNMLYEKLQHQLRCNVEKYMNETLNTLQISRYVRELLSVHNIGQRLFAKYVLGLSQGTVSELLSKPKPWDKLTEKGRDSYRKMHAWSSDDRCINLLKMMVPRKEYGSHLGKDATTAAAVGPYKQDDSAAEERIAQILNEAQRLKGLNHRSDLFANSLLNGNVGDDNVNLNNNLHAMKNECKELSGKHHDTGSENGSDRDENKSDCLDPKSPVTNAALNPTAMATINFYRNMNDSPAGSVNDSSRNNRSNRGSKLPPPPMDDPSSEEPTANQQQQQASELIRLYQDQLTKLIGQQIEEGFRNSQNYDDLRNVMALQQELARVNPFLAQANPDLFARLLSSDMINGTTYLNGLPMGLDPAAGLQSSGQLENLRKSSPMDSPQPPQLRESIRDVSEPRLKIDNLLGQLKPGGTGSPQNGGSSNINNVTSGGIFNNGVGDSPDDLAASPLQRMQSITNSLLSQSSLPSLPSQPVRPAKAVLPPITQQQFDQYNNLNTEEIVKRVKEQLSQYSISQRLFGENVLGLSQGSVSDLLARPKPWHMLTQKGREPFIRMKMFLEDDNAIHKLVASQYKIAPEKLMRTGNFVSGPGIPPIAIHATNMPGQLSSVAAAGSPNHAAMNPAVVQQANTGSCGKGSSSGPGSASSAAAKSVSEQMAVALKYEQSLSPSSVDQNSARSNASSPDLSGPPPPASPLSSAALQSRSRLSAAAAAAYSNNLLRPSGMNQSVAAAAALIQPSVYELAALTSDLDTQIITTRIKETLMAHNIGQKIFGEVVLGLSQGSVSELLSKPKPWHMLSIKGREPFIRMQLWLNDPNNIEKLQTLKNERREANKRRRTHLDDPALSSYKSFDNQLFNFSNNLSTIPGLKNVTPAAVAAAAAAGSFPLTAANAAAAINPQPVVKKARILFTEEQKEALRIAFAMDPYPSSATAEFLAKELNLSIRTITNWFHNHRMRLKQINTTSTNSNTDDSNPPITATNYNVGRDSVMFDQNKFRSSLAQRLADLKLRSAGNNMGGNAHHSTGANNHSASGNLGGDNSNHQFSPFNSQQCSPTHPAGIARMKFSSPFQQSAQSIYSNNTNSCSSPGSNSSYQDQEEDMGTLDLSMSSHSHHQSQFSHRNHRHGRHSPDKLDSTGRSSLHDDSDDGCRSGDDDEDGDQPPPAPITELTENPQQEQQKRKQFRGSSRRKPQNVMSSSSRRKAAQPQQWVAPINPAPLDEEDDYAEEESEDDQLRQQEETRNEINGIYQQLIKRKSNEMLDEDDDDDDLADNGGAADLDEVDQKTDNDEDDGQELDSNNEDQPRINTKNFNNGSPPYKKMKAVSRAATTNASPSLSPPSMTVMSASKLPGIKTKKTDNENSLASIQQECV